MATCLRSCLLIFSTWVGGLWQTLSINPVLLPFVLPVPLAVGTSTIDGTGQPELADCCSTCGDTGAGRAGEQAGQLPGRSCATHSTRGAARGVQSPLSENGKTCTSVLYRKLQTLIGYLSCPYSEQCICLQLSYFKNLPCCKTEDNPGARCLQRADSILCTCHCCVLHNIDQDQINYFFLQCFVQVTKRCRAIQNKMYKQFLSHLEKAKFYTKH